MKKNKNKNFDFDAYIHEITSEIPKSYWDNDLEFTINITNSYVLNNQSVKDAVIAAVCEAISISVPNNVEFTGVRNNQLMFQINKIGIIKKLMLMDIFIKNKIDGFSTTIFYRAYDPASNFLLIVKGGGYIFAELTNVKPNEMQEAIDLSYELIYKGYRLLGGYDELKQEYEKTGSFS